MKRTLLWLSFSFIISSCHSQNPPAGAGQKTMAPIKPPAQPALVVGAGQVGTYLPLLKGKKIALMVNPTSTIGRTHLVDSLLSLKMDIKKVFAPEHGFRGEVGAGEQIKDGLDKKTGVSITSLYGRHKKPSPAQLADIDMVLFDIQDVGARFYTYISTLHYVMEACAENGKTLIILDRPNPNGMYVDGPVLQKGFRSFVGIHPIPILHGLTVGELALMINGEKWLKGGLTCALKVIPVQNYSHSSPYSLPIKPSPNLPNDLSVRLYPSLCLFEGTPVSVGRGTYAPFQHIGYPSYPETRYSFIPKSIEDMAKHPKHEGKRCYGIDLRGDKATTGFSLAYLIDFYRSYPEKKAFFSDFFNRLAGNASLQEKIRQGMDEKAIRDSWAEELRAYNTLRSKYLLYPD